MKEINVSRALTACEQETIISFNRAEDIAHIFTYEKTWQIFDIILPLGYLDEVTENIGHIIGKGGLINGDIP